MANLSISEKASCSFEMENIKTTDPAHADLFNLRFKKLLENDLYFDKNKADKSKMYHTVIPASGWTGSGVPYANTILVSGTTPFNLIELVTPADITQEQVKIYQMAQIINGSQTAGSVTVYAWGEVPTIDLPVTVIVRGDV